MLLINNKNCFPMKNHFWDDIKIKKFEEINIVEYISERYCKYINVRGKNKGKCCGRYKYKNREYCYEHTYNVNKSKNQKTKNTDTLTLYKETNFSEVQNLKTNKIDDFISKNRLLICYHNDNKDLIKINRIIIIDKFNNNYMLKLEEKNNNDNRKPLLICYKNDDSLFKDYIKKIKKRKKNKMKKIKYKNNKNLKIIENKFNIFNCNAQKYLNQYEDINYKDRKEIIKIINYNFMIYKDNIMNMNLCGQRIFDETYIYINKNKHNYENEMLITNFHKNIISCYKLFSLYIEDKKEVYMNYINECINKLKKINEEDVRNL